MRRSEGLWNLDTLQWSEGPGRFAMSGTYAEGGESEMAEDQRVVSDHVQHVHADADEQRRARVAGGT